MVWSEFCTWKRLQLQKPVSKLILDNNYHKGKDKNKALLILAHYQSSKYFKLQYISSKKHFNMININLCFDLIQ